MWIFGSDRLARYKRRRFFDRFRLPTFVAVGLILLPLASYVAGRIVLPEMGLTAPSYGIWFAVFLVYLIFFTAFKLVQELLGYGNS